MNVQRRRKTYLDECELPILSARRRGPVKGHVLVVDDDQPNRELLTGILEGEGIRVSTADDGRDALRAFAGQKPDMVLLDVQMPYLNGFEVCRILKSDPDARLTPVVLVTAFNALEHRIQGHEAGADGFLSKPI